MTLYLVATPIGNLGDISERAKEILRTAHVLAAEDTRTARKLLMLVDISLADRKLVSYGEHNERKAALRLVEQLQIGRNVALLSEGGTPLISDPGFRLVSAAIDAGIGVVPIPGPCAAIAALSASGLPVHSFIFRGFLSRKPGTRRRVLNSLKDRGETLIFYESPLRVERTVEELAEALGADRPACLAREITKLHETFMRLPLGELAAQLALYDKVPGGIKGECTIVVAGTTRGKF